MILESINRNYQSSFTRAFPMAKDRAIGAALVAGAVIGVIIYGSLMFLFTSVSVLVLKLTAFVGVLAILAILGWIGYVMATTPPPVPLEPEAATSTEGAGSAQQPAAPATPEKKS
jgi:hypothetical protein